MYRIFGAMVAVVFAVLGIVAHASGAAAMAIILVGFGLFIAFLPELTRNKK